MSFNPEWTLYRTGKDAERVLTGEQAKDRIERFEQHAEHLPFRAAMEIVRNVQEHFKQPYDPAAPSRRYPLAYWLHYYLKEALLVRGGTVKFFTAVNSLLDLHHGVDGFVDYQTPDGLVVTAPFDLTLNEAKFAGGTHGHFIVPVTEEMIESPEVVKEQSRFISEDLLMRLAYQEKCLRVRLKPAPEFKIPVFRRRRRVPPKQAA